MKNTAEKLTVDAFEDLSKYTTAQLRAMNDYLEPELIRLCNEEGHMMTDEQKRKWFDACTFLNRVGAELLRRSDLPSPGPTGVCFESMPDGSDTVRLSFTILAF